MASLIRLDEFFFTPVWMHLLTIQLLVWVDVAQAPRFAQGGKTEAGKSSPKGTIL